MNRVLTIIDKETGAGYRVLYSWSIDSPSFHEAVEEFYKNKKPEDYKNVVQFVDYNTGDTIKGPKYDNTTQELISGQVIDQNLKKGVKQKEPVEPSEYQPRDRFQENSNMKEINKLRDIIRECISEIKEENNPRNALKEALRGVVKKVIKEVSTNGTPEPKEEDKKEIDKQYRKDGNLRLDKTNVKQQEELDTIVKAIDPTWEAYWDDHNQLIVIAQNLLYVRICPQFEDTYNVDAMVKLVDRIRAIKLSWEQVKAFVKVNFSDIKNSTNADRLTKKSVDNYKVKAVGEKDAGPRFDVIKNRGEKNNGEDAKIKDTKKDDRDYNEPQTKRDEDLPDRPMKLVTKPGEDPESKNKNIEKTDKVKPPKHKNDKKLRVGDKKTPKFVKKQVNAD